MADIYADVERLISAVRSLEDRVRALEGVVDGAGDELEPCIGFIVEADEEFDDGGSEYRGGAPDRRVPRPGA